MSFSITICHSLNFSSRKGEKEANQFITPHVRGRVFYTQIENKSYPKIEVKSSSPAIPTLYSGEEKKLFVWLLNI